MSSWHIIHDNPSASSGVHILAKIICEHTKHYQTGGGFNPRTSQFSVHHSGS